MLDQLDSALVHALRIDGRASYARIGEVLGVSTQTVARRYRRLRERAGLRVIGMPFPDRAGLTQWMIRLTVAPANARPVAESLVRRSDTQWVKLTSGGTEIFAIVNAAPEADTARAMLLHDIPRTASVTAVSAHCMLHMYLGGPTTWGGFTRMLSEHQQRALAGPEPEPGTARPLEESDSALLTALQRDGRASYVELAEATGWSQATVARRLTELRADRAVYFDLEIDDALFGVRTEALLWLAVDPARLDAVARSMTTHAELASVIATTGPTNLMATALCANPAELHDYLIGRVGALEGIRTLETAPVLRNLKAASPVPR
ncbi:Lrp/AsnC family transcriptional regulator [Sciscionella marina]|uniref:Lrp/AsnC family transcriptional regulator n=1 Tax=Sciscionella marina TaxID=508770 RepID=UPI000367A0AB|nr:AsnC family transcriptional regulator [Sciscionella marina]